MSKMTNKKLIARKIERAKRIVGQSTETAPPLWAIIWSKRTSDGRDNAKGS